MDVEHVVQAPNDKSMNAMTDKIPEEKTTENKTYKRQLNRKAPNQESRNVTQLESLEPKATKIPKFSAAAPRMLANCGWGACRVGVPDGQRFYDALANAGFGFSGLGLSSGFQITGFRFVQASNTVCIGFCRCLTKCSFVRFSIINARKIDVLNLLHRSPIHPNSSDC